MNLTDRQLATTLAALRYWQREGRMSAGHEHDIASAGDSLVPLNDDEINALCEDLKCGPANPLIRHLTEELQAIIKAIDEDNPGRAHWLARTAVEHIAKQESGAGVPSASHSLTSDTELCRLHDQLSELLENPHTHLLPLRDAALALQLHLLRYLTPPSPEAEARRKRIIELAQEQCGDAEIDEDARVFEGCGNGCYVSARIWCSFMDTEFDKDAACPECGQPTDDGEGYDGLCGNCADIKQRRLTTTEYTGCGRD